MADDIYRSFAGFVKFEPREGEAAGKDIRSFVFRATGVKDQAMDIRATLWPSHEHVELEQDDFVAVEGKFAVNKATKDGKPVTYYNLSVSKVVVLGKGDGGDRPETTDDDADTEDDEAY